VLFNKDIMCVIIKFNKREYLIFKKTKKTK
jgi:hypothetical protein